MLQRSQVRHLLAPGMLALGICLGLVACGSGEDLVTGCEDVHGIHPVCGFQNPEDLALLPDGRTLVVSQFGAMDGSRPGSLALFDLQSETLRVAYRGGADDPAPVAGWGAADCPGPPPAGFAPHGIDLAPRRDGRLQLLVVNHGGRESVEFFEIAGSGEQARIAWRGCAVAPDHSWLNDVVGLPEGGFLVTHMMDKESRLTGMISASLGRNTGVVYEWHDGSGFSAIPGSEGPFPNGIELSPDGHDVFVNLYTAGEVRRISRETGEVLGRAAVAQPDNATWGRDGRLLVASHDSGLRDVIQCNDLEQGACPFAFEIVALDPGTMEREVIFANSGPPMGAATVALDLGDELVMGSFAGDRIIRAPRARH
jgi:hypothetical protein